MNGIVRILGIPGSLRKASFNRAALRAAQDVLPTDATLEIFDLDGIPLFNEDDERTIMGHRLALRRTARAHYHLRQAFVFRDMFPVNRPEVMISSATQRLDDRGNLVNGTSRKLVGQLVEALVAWTQRLGKDS